MCILNKKLHALSICLDTFQGHKSWKIISCEKKNSLANKESAPLNQKEKRQQIQHIMSHCFQGFSLLKLREDRM